MAVSENVIVAEVVNLKKDETGTRDQAVTGIRTRLAQYIPEGAMLSEELLADRREEAARE